MIQNVAVWFAIVMSLVGIIVLALIIVGVCFARRKYEEWKEKKKVEEELEETKQKQDKNFT